MTTRAALIISDLGGGDYEVTLVDKERFEQIKEISDRADSANNDTTIATAVDVISYLIGAEKDAVTAHAQRPDLYPVRRGQLLGTKFTQDFVVEASEDWPEVHIFSIITVRT